MTADVSTERGGYLVLSEAQYPGWRARIDGAIVPVQRVDVMFQGVAVPAGRHSVVFEFASTTLRAGFAISTLALAFALFLGVGSVHLSTFHPSRSSRGLTMRSGARLRAALSGRYDEASPKPSAEAGPPGHTSA